MPAYFKQILYQNQYFVLQHVKCLIKKSARKWEWKWNMDTIYVFLWYESLLDIASTNTSLQCTVLKVLTTFQMKTTKFFSPLQTLMCGERDKIRLQKNSCSPTWLGPASIAAMSWLQLVLHVQGSYVSTLSTEASCPDTFSWVSLVTSHKDKEST
jgi:hypothetical protein